MKILNEKKYKLKLNDAYEVFVAVDGADDYYISSRGRLIKLVYDQPVIVPQRLDNAGESKVDLQWNDRDMLSEEHTASLVAKAFLANEEGVFYVWYKDGNRQNLDCRNLFYVKDSEVQDILKNPRLAKRIGERQQLMSYFNLSDYKIYQLYYNCFTRCYNEEYKDKYKHYKGVTVCDEWIDSKESFYKWVRDNFYDYPQELQFDKDILSIRTGKRIYSPENCCFVPKDVNILFRQFFDKGTSIKTRVKKDGSTVYSVNLTYSKNRSEPKTFYTEEEAVTAFKRNKIALLSKAYHKLNDFGYDVPQYIRDALREWYDAIDSGKIEFTSSGMIS